MTQASDEDRGLEPIGTYAARVLLEAFRDDECTSVSQALDPLFDILEARDAAVRLQQREHDARVLEGEEMSGPSPLGILYVAGWNGAVEVGAAAIRGEKP